MKIVVSKDELFQKLSTVQNIVEKKNTMPVLSHFLLEAGKGGSFITATDLDTALREPIDLKVEKEGKICIPAKKMFEIVREIDGEISCDSVDEQWLKIKAGAGSFRLACLSASEFPAWPAMEGSDTVAVDSKTLVDVIEKTVYSAGESDTRYTLNGLLFHIKTDNRFTVVGTDGHRLALMVGGSTGSIGEEKKLIIPRKAAVELRKLLDKQACEVSLAISKNHVLFSASGVQFLTRLIEGTYPNYEQVIPSSNDKKITVQRASLSKAVRRVSIMSREKSNAIKCDLSTDMITITSSNPDIGEAQDMVAAQYQGEEISLGFNARYLMDILENMTSDNVSIECQAPLSPVLVRDEAAENYRCVIMPMRI